MGRIYRDMENVREDRLRRTEEQEQALLAMRRAEVAEQDVTRGFVKLDGEEIRFVRRSFLQEKTTVLLPQEWKPMAPELIKVKYPYEERPTHVYSDDSSTLNWTLLHMQMPLRSEEIAVCIGALKRCAINIRGAEAMADGLLRHERSGYMIGWHDFANMAADMPMYNLIACTCLEGRALVSGFSCPAQAAVRWRSLFRQMLQTWEVNGLRL